MGRVPKNTLRESKKRLPLTPLGTSPSLPLDGLDGLLAGWLAGWLHGWISMSGRFANDLKHSAFWALQAPSHY